jgi:hypothetical protein
MVPALRGLQTVAPVFFPKALSLAISIELVFAIAAPFSRELAPTSSVLNGSRTPLNFFDG